MSARPRAARERVDENMAVSRMELTERERGRKDRKKSTDKSCEERQGGVERGGSRRRRGGRRRNREGDAVVVLEESALATEAFQPAPFGLPIIRDHPMLKGGAVG